MLENLRNDLKNSKPSDLVDALIDSYIEIKENYYLQKHEPSELNGGKLVEALARILEYTFNGTYTAIGTSISNMPQFLKNFEQKPTTFHDSLRLHIPRALITIYNIRNRRGVGHLSGDVNPNFADSTLIASLADWCIAELFRLQFSMSLNEAQKIVDQLVKRKLLLMHDINGVVRILNPNLKYKEQVLLLLTHAYPDPLTEEQLITYTEHPKKSNLRSNVLKPLHDLRYIEKDDTYKCIILPPGLAFVETNYNKWINCLNGGRNG
jgi:hypothetical protein